MRKRTGYTLIELMLVVTIIGVLASLSVVRYRKMTDKAKAAEATLWCNRIAKAIEMLGSETGEWPGHTPAGYVCMWPNNEISDLENNPAAGLIRDDPRKPFINWNGPYISKIPLDPWGSKYAWDSDYWDPAIQAWVAAVVSFGPNKRGLNIYDEDNIIVILSTEELPDEYYITP